MKPCSRSSLAMPSRVSLHKPCYPVSIAFSFRPLKSPFNSAYFNSAYFFSSAHFFSTVILPLFYYLSDFSSWRILTSNPTAIPPRNIQTLTSDLQRVHGVSNTRLVLDTQDHIHPVTHHGYSTFPHPASSIFTHILSNINVRRFHIHDVDNLSQAQLRADLPSSS